MGEIGGNDYNYAFFQNKPMEEIHTYVPHVVGAITHGVREVIRAGAKHIVVPGNFPVGCIPIYLSSFRSQNRRAYDDMGCLVGLNEFARYHNNYLQGALEQLRREFPSVVIVYGDYYNAFQSVLRRSRSLGFDQSSVLRACCGVVGAPYNYDGSWMCGSPGVPVSRILLDTSIGMESISHKQLTGTWQVGSLMISVQLKSNVKLDLIVLL
ncbi:hypothetical protein MKW98_022592 [Papaver atlanticum]|uniref:GDSL esterase/lipase n=1 Tax=Papaver atlanticum TaxID=357466 RepID=A0AAD4SLF3_9MAGN|nr:hypothetical protein MKW98_022592 [Papaver atlanticum]